MSQIPTRRKFLTNGVGLVSLAALGGGGLVIATGVDDVIEGIVRHHIGCAADLGLMGIACHKRLWAVFVAGVPQPAG